MFIWKEKLPHECKLPSGRRIDRIAPGAVWRCRQCKTVWTYVGHVDGLWKRGFDLIEELRILAWFATGRKNSEMVPLADFTRERIARALHIAADRLEETEL